jgi:hypothetical protein
MNVIFVWKLVITMWPNHADVAGALQMSRVTRTQKQGVSDKYSMSEEFTKENSLLLFAVVYLRGEFRIGIKYVINEAIRIV